MASPKKHLKTLVVGPKIKKVTSYEQKLFQTYYIYTFIFFALLGEALMFLFPPKKKTCSLPSSSFSFSLCSIFFLKIWRTCGEAAVPVRTYLKFSIASKIISLVPNIANIDYRYISATLQEECWQLLLPASESPWSTFPWFIRLLGRTATHQQVLARAERVAQVGKPGIWVPRILQQREY